MSKIEEVSLLRFNSALDKLILGFTDREFERAYLTLGDLNGLRPGDQILIQSLPYKEDGRYLNIHYTLPFPDSEEFAERLMWVVSNCPNLINQAYRLLLTQEKTLLKGRMYQQYYSSMPLV